MIFDIEGLNFVSMTSADDEKFITEQDGAMMLMLVLHIRYVVIGYRFPVPYKCIVVIRTTCNDHTDWCDGYTLSLMIAS